MVGLYYSASILAGRASAPYMLPSFNKQGGVRGRQMANGSTDHDGPCGTMRLRIRGHVSGARVDFG